MIAFDWPITRKDVEGYTPEIASQPYVDPIVGAMVLKPDAGIGLFETEADLIRRGAVYTWQEAHDAAKGGR